MCPDFFLLLLRFARGAGYGVGARVWAVPRARRRERPRVLWTYLPVPELSSWKVAAATAAAPTRRGVGARDGGRRPRRRRRRQVGARRGASILPSRAPLGRGPGSRNKGLSGSRASASGPAFPPHRVALSGGLGDCAWRQPEARCHCVGGWPAGGPRLCSEERWEGRKPSLATV